MPVACRNNLGDKRIDVIERGRLKLTGIITTEHQKRNNTMRYIPIYHVIIEVETLSPRREVADDLGVRGWGAWLGCAVFDRTIRRIIGIRYDRRPLPRVLIPRTLPGRHCPCI